MLVSVLFFFNEVGGFWILEGSDFSLWQHFTLHTLHLTLRTIHFTLHVSLDMPLYSLCILNSTFYTWHFTLYTLHFTLLHSTLDTPALTLTLHTLHSRLYTPHSTLYTLHCKLYIPQIYIVHSTLHTLHSTLYTPHSTLYTLHSTLYTLSRLPAYVLRNLYNYHTCEHSDYIVGCILSCSSFLPSRQWQSPILLLVVKDPDISIHPGWKQISFGCQWLKLSMS